MNDYSHQSRVGWVDFAKGICVVCVVAMYSSYYIGDSNEAPNWMMYWVDFAQTFRMPTFFLVAGLFLQRTLDRPWRQYLDKKVVHFAYFFALWTTIYFVLQFAFSENFTQERPIWLEYLRWYVDPFHMLWFIAMLPVYLVVTRLLRHAPWLIVLLAAAALQILHPESGMRQIDRFGERFVYFYAGYLFAPLVFQVATWARRQPIRSIFILCVWALVNGSLALNGLSYLPVVSLALGFAGAFAVVLTASLLSGLRTMDWLRYLGEHSLTVFLAYYLFMVIAAKLFWASNLIQDEGTLALLVTGVGVVGPLCLRWLVQHTPAHLLFERPAWAKIDHGVRDRSKLPSSSSASPGIAP